jgi:HlyD family secretion protein
VRAKPREAGAVEIAPCSGVGDDALSQDTDITQPPKSAALVDGASPSTVNPPAVALPSVMAPSAVPAPIPHPKTKRRPWGWVALIALALAAAGWGGYTYWRQSQSVLPVGIAFSNGRIEADEIDIDAKYAARIAEMFVDEGDMVKANDRLARMDTRDIEATLKKSQSLVEEASRTLDEARANVIVQATQLTFAQQELDRTTTLVPRGAATVETLDQRRQALEGAKAAVTAATDRVAEAERALDAATHDVELYKVQISDSTLFAPREGRIQYRLANLGEVVAAGGRVFTMLDVLYVYMDVYLPTADAGKIKIGSDARIVLDALPNLAIPAKVAFVATDAQFTPKTVETKDERDKLMFRVRVRIDPARLRARGDAVRSGLPGVAYVKWDPKLVWPAALLGPDGVQGAQGAAAQ